MSLWNDHIQLVKDLAKPGNDILQQLTAEDCHILHMLIGVIGEVLELELAVITQDHELTAAEVIEELGDIEFFLTGLCISLNVDPGADESTNKVGTLAQLRIAAEDLLTVIKRYIIYNQRDKYDELRKALEHFRKCLRTYYITHDISQGEVLHKNIMKLRKRYGETYSDAAAKARKDKNA